MKRVLIFLIFVSVSTVYVKSRHGSSSRNIERQLHESIPYREKPEFSASKYYEMIQEAYGKEDYTAVIHLGQYMFEEFADAPFINEIHYFVAMSHYALNNYDFASKGLSKYLRIPGASYFQKAIDTKFVVAKVYANKSKGHFQGIRQFVKRPFNRSKALRIFDELIDLVAFSDIAAYSLFYKGELLNAIDEFEEAIESFETLIHGFGRHELIPASYLGIAEAYLIAYRSSNSKNPDLLDLCELSVRKFITEYPTHELIPQAEKYMAAMQEEYAKDLYDTGRFYERIGEKTAAKLYYKSVLEKFGATHCAKRCQIRLKKLDKRYS